MIVTPCFTTESEREHIAKFRQDYLQDIGAKFAPSFLETYSLRDWEYGITLYHSMFSESDCLLDVGGGESFFMAYAAKFINQGYIVDNAFVPRQWYDDWVKMMMQFAAFQSGKVKIIEQNAKSLPFEDKFFDKVVTFSALEHFLDDDDTLVVQEIYRVLKDDGIFLGTVDFNPCNEYPHPTSPDYRAYTYESFWRRIMRPSKFKLVGETNYLSPLPKKVDYIASALFFALKK